MHKIADLMATTARIKRDYDILLENGMLLVYGIVVDQVEPRILSHLK